MTTVDKPVTRRTRGSYAVLYREARPIVVSVLPGDVLEFREAGRRQRAEKRLRKKGLRLRTSAATEGKR